MSATYAQFLSDPLRVSIWLAEVSYYNPDTETTGTFYYSTDSYGTAADDSLASQLFSPRLMHGYNFAAATDTVGVFGGILPARDGGTLTLAQNMGDLDGHRLLSFDNRSVVVRHGGYSPVYGQVAYDDFTVVYDGVALGQALVGIDTVTIQLASFGIGLEFPIQDRRYTGGTYWLYFNGSSTYVACGEDGSASSHLDFTTSPFTIEFFICVDASPGSSQMVMSRGGAAVDGWLVRHNTGNTISLVTHPGGGATTVTTSSALSLNRRTHVAIVRSGTSVTIYFDGVDVTVTSGTHADPLTADRVFLLGCLGGGTNFFNGHLDEVRIWDTARNLGTINALRDRQLQASEMTSSLMFYTKLDDGTGNVIRDTSSYDIECTATNPTWHPSLQGGEELEGMPLPDVWGQRHGYVPVLVDEPRMIYQVHSGSVYETSQVLVGGVVIGYDLAPNTTYTTFATFLNASTESGCYERLVTQYGTWIRLGSAPSFPVTMTVKGDNTGGTGYGDASTYRSTVSDIVRYVICNRGPQPLTDPADLDGGSFDDLDTANSTVVGDGYSDERTVYDVVRYLLASVGAVGWFARDTGLFTVYRFSGVSSGTVVLDLSEKDVAEGTLEVLDVGAPVWGVNLYWKKNDFVHSSADIAAAIITASPPPSTNWRFLMTEWRTSSPRNRAVRSAYNGATVMEVETAIQTYVGAAAESARLLALYSSPGQCVRAFFRERAVQLDLMDFVTFSFEDLDQYGELQQRLGTASDSVFAVLAVEDEVENGGTWLTLYREAVT